MRSEEERYYSGSEKHRSSRDGKKFRMNDGDWVCPDPQCANVNFARRTSCNRCGKDKIELPSKRKLGHEIGKAAAEKSRGLFSADDWQCGRCGNVNWARRSTCNMCNAPKFGEVEERTGLGGGYNERENVEYIEREESDGEYDDFGRRKKRRRKDDEDSRAESSSDAKKDSKSDEEDEEDDEDDEEGDLSKYDLSGWGDDTDTAGDKKEDSKADSQKKRHSSGSSSSSSSSGSSRSSERQRRRRSSSTSSSRSESSSSSSRSRSHSGSRNRQRPDENSQDSSSGRSSTQSSTRRRSRSRERFARGKKDAWGSSSCLPLGFFAKHV